MAPRERRLILSFVDKCRESHHAHEQLLQPEMNESADCNYGEEKGRRNGGRLREIAFCESPRMMNVPIIQQHFLTAHSFR
jgi:hypothetical protein